MNDISISKFQSILPKVDDPHRISFNDSSNDLSNDSSESSFGDYIKRSLNDVNNKMLKADQAIDDLVTGKNQDIHNTMIAMQKAEVSFEVVMQIRNKIIAAYDEIRKMSI